jgi:hypothetical protein
LRRSPPCQAPASDVAGRVLAEHVDDHHVKADTVGGQRDSRASVADAKINRWHDGRIRRRCACDGLAPNGQNVPADVEAVGRITGFK